MESQKFEELEPVEQVETDIPAEKPELKEYEKLLLAEANRETYEKAVNLIKFGCFNQQEIPTVDYSKYTRIDSDKKYKGLYTLYQDNETLELVFICALIENNKGDDKEERTNMKPYAYDCIFIESMDDETYQMVTKAAKNNINTYVKTLVGAAWTVFFAAVALGLTLMIYFAIIYSQNNSSYSWHLCIFSATAQVLPIIAGEMISLPLLVLMSIKYKKYKDQ